MSGVGEMHGEKQQLKLILAFGTTPFSLLQVRPTFTPHPHPRYAPVVSREMSCSLPPSREKIPLLIIPAAVLQ